MSRLLTSLIFGLAAFLVLPSSLDGRCPFNAGAQFQVMIQWQRQRSFVTQQQRFVTAQRFNYGGATRFQTSTRRFTNTNTNFAVNRQRITATQTRFTAARQIARTTRVTHFSRLTGSTGRCMKRIEPTRFTVRQTFTRARTTVQCKTTTTSRMATRITRFTSTTQKKFTTTQRIMERPRQFESKQTKFTTTRKTIETHKPSVRLQITMNFKCGSCHKCSHRPGIKSDPLPPMRITPRPNPGPIPAIVRPTPRPGPGIMPPPRPTPGYVPRPAPVPIVRLDPLPRRAPGPGLLPLPMPRPPVLPGPGLKPEPTKPEKSIGEMLTTIKKPSEDRPTVPSLPTADRAPPTLEGGLALARLTPPPVPEETPLTRPGGALLLPTVKRRAPVPEPLAGLRPGLPGLLPTLANGEAIEREDLPEDGASGAVELASRPPVVPPLPDPVIR